MVLSILFPFFARSNFFIEETFTCGSRHFKHCQFNRRLPASEGRKMKRILTLSVTAILLGVGLSGPAMAQYYGGGNWNNNQNNINQSQFRLQSRINAGVANGRISQREAAKLSQRMAELNQMESRMRASGRGLSFSERARLNAKIASVNFQITKELNDFEHRRIGYWGGRRSF